ncbi:TauD/TfdA family dioxygenase [Nostoc favosum]|uniref:TauD/TfdA family dioxygenase n=1 Tax=Nostoc favosum CHAB5714 TaxID=2780399 RepID=A0ABS8IHU8_9NOSO|nr:TauD/TfdA family dioxygenase [Nostoc favosum]MCC5603390.1 TauD/TfdA family dioxygenase [Nostoc favosum CHAB5714]
MLKIESLGTSTARIVYSKDDQSILSLPTHEVLEMFKSFGLLLFRGFGVTYEQMKEFSKKFSSKFVRDPYRQIVGSFDDFVQLVDNGMDEVLPHCENSASPFRPDVVWFCCGVPAAQDGETLFWDGVRVWEQLGEPVKQLFISKRVKFKYNFDAEHWKLFFGAGTTIADVKQTLNNIKDVDYQIQEDESIYFEYTCSVVVKTKFGNQDAFGNSIILYYQEPLYDQEPEVSEEVKSHITENSERVSFEDGSPISHAVIDEIKGVMDKLTGVISWQPGDLVMIDNSKFLHGRRAFQDEQRQIYTHLSYLTS